MRASQACLTSYSRLPYRRMSYTATGSAGAQGSPRGPGAWACPPRGASTKRRRRRSRRARPNIWRFSIVRRLICPSTGPELQGKVTPAVTAASSSASPVAKRRRTSSGRAVARGSPGSSASGCRCRTRDRTPARGQSPPRPRATGRTAGRVAASRPRGAASGPQHHPGCSARREELAHRLRHTRQGLPGAALPGAEARGLPEPTRRRGHAVIAPRIAPCLPLAE